MTRASAVTCFLICFFVTPVRAEEGELTPAAHTRLERGISLYHSGAIDDAIVEFTAAYAISPAPALLFDLGQAYRKKGELAMAITAYRGYVGARPLAEDAPAVRAKISALEGQLRRDTLAPVPPPAPIVDHSGARRGRIIGALAATGALGVMALGVGGALFARAEGDAAALSAAPHGSTFDDGYRELYADGRTSNGAAIGLFVAGGAAVAGAVTTAILQRKALHRRSHFRDGRWVF